MSYQYRGPKPERNYTVKDFQEKGITVRVGAKWKDYTKGFPSITVGFRSNGLRGTIRTSCYGNTFCVDFRWGWHTSEETCLTTECKSIREAKSILYMAFKEKGFVIPKEITDRDWSKNYLAYPIKK